MSLAARIRVARGLDVADLVVRNVRFLDVFTGRFLLGDVAVSGGTIVSTRTGGPKGLRTVDGTGKCLVPGFIDAHVHVESSLLSPWSFSKTVLACGTTTAICDPHELANVQGERGLAFFLAAAEKTGIDLRVMMSSCVPATTMETNGGGSIEADVLARLATHPKALGLAELMNVPGILHGDSGMLAKLEAFTDRPKDGHAPLLRGHDLAAYACAGITSCHESSELDEAREKVENGIAVWIREGSVAKDLDALYPLLIAENVTKVGFCTDDRNPLDIAEEGHLDHLVRKAIAHGIPAPIAFRAASYGPALHYGLAGPSTRERVGAIAPGFRADFVLLGDADTVAIEQVYRAGIPANEIAHESIAFDHGNSMKASVPEAADLLGPSGSVHVIGVRPGRILTDRHVMAHDAPGVARLTVVERHGHGRRPANGYVTGFGTLTGAIASSVGHDCHNLVAVGTDVEEMRVAMRALIEVGGGFVVVKDGAVLEMLPLPLGGLMSLADPKEVETKLRALRAASKAIGCEVPEPFLQLAFLSLPVIPSLKLTDHGLVDVDLFKIIDVRAA